MLERLHADSFDWITWRGGNITEFIPAARYELIINNINLFKKYAIGYLEGERLNCRPKINEIAVMFRKDGKDFWFHMRKNEFEEILK